MGSAEQEVRTDISAMKKGPRLILEHNIIFQITGDDHFWELVPEFEDLRDEGEQARQAALQVAEGKKCKGCSTVKGAMKPFVERFMRRLADLHKQGGSRSLMNFHNYLIQKLGYIPKEVLLYYKDLAGRTTQLRF